MVIVTTTNPYWNMIWPSDGIRRLNYESEEDYWQHCGKWVIEGTELEIYKAAFKIDKLVEEGKIPEAKFTKKDPETDPWPHIPTYALIVYSDDRCKDDVADLLKELGYNEFKWVYDRESEKAWSPGGENAKIAGQVGRSVNPREY